MAILQAIKQYHRDLQARAAKYFRTQEIVRVLSSSHMRELASTPGNEWGLVKSRHAAEIQAVRDGKFDIVDRRTWQFPYIPEALHRLNQPILKNTPYNLRRFSETPIPRRAINLIKNGVLSLDWKVQPIAELEDQGNPSEREKRIRIATNCFLKPNNVDSYRTFSEAVLEDMIAGGYGCLEPRMTPYYKRPFKMWPVDGSTIRLYADWSEGTPDRPRFAQMTGLKGERGIVAFLQDELVYIKDNSRSNTPFGLGKLEVGFNTINAFLGSQDMASKAGSDQVHKTFLWWEQPQNQAHVQTVRRHIQNELEGQAKISMIAGMKKPEVIPVEAVKPEDLLLDWQEMLIRIIASAFELSPFSLGLEKDVNRNTGLIMALSDFRGAVVPMAIRFQEALTRHILHGFLGWKDLEFVFEGLDDPDALTKVQIQQREYQMNARTPDEIRKANGDPPLPSGWGKITMLQGQLLLLEAQSKSRAAGGGAGAGASGGYGGGGFGTPSSGLPGTGGAGAASPTAATSGGMRGFQGSLIGAGEFDTDDIQQMTPEEVQYFQEMGMLPDTSDLAQQMDIQQPGILEQLSDELKEFFEMAEEDEKNDEDKPQKVSNADNRSQEQKYEQSLRQPTVVEQYLNDRYRGWKRTDELMPAEAALSKSKKVQQGKRGKYPRSGGEKGLYK